MSGSKRHLLLVCFCVLTLGGPLADTLAQAAPGRRADRPTWTAKTWAIRPARRATPGIHRRMQARPGRGRPPATRSSRKPASPRTGFTRTTDSGIATTWAAGKREFILVDTEDGTREAGVRPPEAGRGSRQGQRRGRDRQPTKLPFDAIEFADDWKSVRFRVGRHYLALRPGHVRVHAFQERSRRHSSAGQAADAGRGRPGPAWRRIGRSRGLVGAIARQEVDGLRQGPQRLPRREGSTGEIKLSDDGKEGLAYGRLSWSPDSKTLVALRIEPGERKEVYLIQSSPPGGGRAKLQTRPYPLPGDKFDGVRAEPLRRRRRRRHQAQGRPGRFRVAAAALAARTAAISPTRRSTAATSGSA